MITNSPVRWTTLDNGLTVVVEEMPEVQSAAYSLLLPAGGAHDPGGANGLSSVLCDWLTRGAGDRDNRAYSREQDRLGLDHNETVSPSHMIFNAACLTRNLPAALRLLGDLIIRPRFDEDEFEPCVAGAEHELQALEDDPSKKVMLELVRQFNPAPWNQPPEGTLDDLHHLTPDLARAHFQKRIRPNAAILGIAGRVDWDTLIPEVERAFAGWAPAPVDVPPYGTRGERTSHIPATSTQTQIGIAYPAVPYRHPDYYAAWAAVSVLSGGMSSRLFTEVREKRGLCYSVYASLSTLRDEGAILCYAGTTNERAQETLDVLRQELWRLQDGIADAELNRAKALAKSSLVMQQESSSARARSIAADYYHLARVTSLDEVQSRIDALTPEIVEDYVRRHPPEPATIVTIGPNPLSAAESR